MSNQKKYSELMNELESIIAEIESENISVDELSDKVKRASELIKVCNKILTETEGEVEKILAEMKSDKSEKPEEQ